jgi:small subunit ribosomal protein S9
MVDEEKPDTPEETPPSENPTEPIGEGHAVPSEDATEIASSVEDSPLEALQEAEEAATPQAEQTDAEQDSPAEEPVAGETAGPQAEQEQAVAAGEPSPDAEEPAPEVPAAEEPTAEEQSPEETDEEEEPAPRVKPSVPGAHLEVDIVPEGVDPLGRSEGYEDPYAVEDDEAQAEQSGEDEQEQEALSEPISTAAIDLASGARYRATGKRKTAIARVTLRPGSGTYLVNGRALEEHFPRLTLQRNIRQPLETVGYQERMDVVARLHGGGISAQAGALRHGVSRALLEADPNLRGELKRRGFLTRDSRAKERKKAGLKKARKRPQFSKR